MAKQGERLTRRLAGAALASVLAVIIAATLGIAAIANGGEDTLRNQVVKLNDVRQEIAETHPTTAAPFKQPTRRLQAPRMRCGTLPSPAAAQRPAPLHLPPSSPSPPSFSWPSTCIAR